MTGASAVLAGIVLIASGISLAVFFARGSEVWGRVNDATTAAWALLMLPAALEIWSRYADRGWGVVPATVLAVSGDLVIAGTSGATAAGALDWRRSAAIGAGGFAAFALWMGAVSAMTLRWGGLPEALARSGIMALALVLASAILGVRFTRLGGPSETRRPPPVTTVVWLLAFLSIPAWCIGLGVSLLRTP